MILDGPIDILAKIKVGVTIAVKVGESGAGTPEVRAEQPGHLGRLDEAPAPGGLVVLDVVVQGQPAIARDEQIRPAVTVVIGHGGTVAVEEDRAETDFPGDVLKLPAA